MILHLRRDFRLGIVKMLGPITALLLCLYAVYLAMTGQVVACLVTTSLGLLAVWRGWQMRSAERTGAGGVWLASINVGGCLVACWTGGDGALIWLFPVLATNYLLCGPRRAVLLSLPLLAALLFLPGLITSPGQGVSTIVGTLVTLAVGYAFSLRMQDDRVHLEELASLDALTGLPNRRMLERALTDQINQRQPHDRLNSLIILDLDHFKEVNDLYGHAAGDAALSDLATILRFEVRDPHQVFRFSGEEFVVLLRAGSLAELEAATERLRKVIRNGLRGPGGRITVSLGAARHDGETHWQDWFSRADAALYLAKNGGRDSARVAE
ncbi:GGDEF domain-containing protein [Xanthomonas oryzae]|uniref:GGDEF domain-containing protein n=1 Tax=Xanthomonas oryzae TaxID=347 RepID=UPI00094A08BF|nr:GGDEF domain-containing protein [Xanthomonas oryzae]OLG32542.1 diguanylate cyclase [Xanthomonas oryzae pv. oryzae]QGN61907.1 diguanylate cyclase [Xanthomonas oryzae pv. oryzae]